MRALSGYFRLVEALHNQIRSNYGGMMMMMIMMTVMIAFSVLFTVDKVRGVKTNPALLYNPYNESLIKKLDSL